MLVAHDQAPDGAAALEDAVWQLAESHLVLPGSLVVESPVSPKYLLEHLRGALRRMGRDGALLIVPLTTASWAGLSTDAEEWIRARMP
ncbi:hypothetical protein E0493_01125 [Roseomonas sp. M0104]|uniref:Uncharacterized protein n=1 Tax=Teichococcus coralli TaxID=2545983 RepID=A0A845B429_9PROT|nr:hypothetical protein [Pseudoroseomonas coralli]MXP61951.1 hypothetical protein [Pseudoroseomonas coralli]